MFRFWTNLSTSLTLRYLYRMQFWVLLWQSVTAGQVSDARTPVATSVSVKKREALSRWTG